MAKKLRPIILQHLACTPRSGYGLIKDIEAATGWKPSYGSIYPQLDQLRAEGLITFFEEGRKKVYSLTARGKEAVDGLNEINDELIARMRKDMNIVAHMMGIDDERHAKIMDAFFSALQRGDQPFKEINNASMQMQTVFWQLYEKGLIKRNEKQINKILMRATKELIELEEKNGKN